MRHSNRRSTKLVGMLAATAVALGAMLAEAPLAADGAAVPVPAVAHAASTSTLNETGQLHLVSKQGFTLNEQGTRRARSGVRSTCA